MTLLVSIFTDYSFPYIILVVSVVTNAVHFASMDEGVSFEILSVSECKVHHKQCMHCTVTTNLP